MLKLKIVWMLLVLKCLRHILWILDELQEPYMRRTKDFEKLIDKCGKVEKQLNKELE